MVQSLAEPLELLLRALFDYYSKGEEDGGPSSKE